MDSVADPSLMIDDFSGGLMKSLSDACLVSDALGKETRALILQVIIVDRLFDRPAIPSFVATECFVLYVLPRNSLSSNCSPMKVYLEMVWLTTPSSRFDYILIRHFSACNMLLKPLP